MPNTESIPILKTETVSDSGCPFHETTGARPTASAPEATASRHASTFMVLSKFIIANDKAAEVKEGFRQRPHLVDGQPGFVRMEVFSALDKPEEIWLVTFWADAGSFQRWRHSHLYQEVHRGIPKGLKLVPGAQEIRHFEHVCS